jgi:hypothetical protein
VEQLGYRIIVNKLLAANDQVAASVILDQFYKNPDLPLPAQPEVVARAIQLGVQDKALGLAELKGEELDPLKLKYGQAITLDSVTFEPGVYVVSQSKAEELLAKIPPPPALPGAGHYQQGNPHHPSPSGQHRHPWRSTNQHRRLKLTAPQPHKSIDRKQRKCYTAG